MTLTRPAIQTDRRLPTLSIALMSLLAMLAALVVAAPAAGAATFCDNTDGEVVILVDEDDPDDRTYIGMEYGELFVNNQSCGIAETIAIVDIGEEKVDDIVIDLSSPMRSGDSLVSVTLFLEVDPDTGDKDLVTVLGRNTPDYAALGPFNLNISRSTNYPGSNNSIRLAMNWADSDPFRLDVRLKGGDDTFTMYSEDGDFFEHPVVVRGGSGNDILTGGEHRQRLRGGKGRDTLTGGKGNDDLLGQSGRDILRGSSGDDMLDGGTGADQMFGGSGNDDFFADDGVVDSITGGPGGGDTCVECDPDDDIGDDVENT